MLYLSPHEPLTLDYLASLLGSKEPVRLSPDTAPTAPPYPPAAAEAAQQTGRLLAYACGTGPELPPELVRRLLLLQAHRLGQGGGTLATARRLLDFYNREVWPVVPAQGARGAYGDQIPLAHLGLPLLGLGEVNYQGYRLAAADVLGLLGWEPLALSAQEGPTLLSGYALSLAYATEAAERAALLLRAAATIAALAAQATGQHEPGGETAPVPAAAAPGDLPLGLGGTRTALTEAARLVDLACQAAGGPAGPGPANNEAAPEHLLLLALNHLAVGATELGRLSGQRAAHLVAGLPGLPPYLAAEPAVGFGFVALPLTVASLLDYNQQLGAAAAATTGAAVPAALSAGAATGPSARLLLANVEQLLGIELLTAAQALDLRYPAGPGAVLASPAHAAAVAAFRAHVTLAAHDRLLAPALARAARFVREYAWE